VIPEHFNAGLRIANYVVEREVARGGQGVVLAAKHASLGTPVAIKLLFEQDAEASERFLREAKTLARLQHPNLIRVSDLGRLSNGIPYLVMEFVSGQDLANWVRTGGVPSLQATARVLGTLAGVLHYCHEQGVVHRDVKPQNVMLEEKTGRVLLVDFGLVKRQKIQAAWSTQDMRSLTEDGMILGTPAFMAPEQASNEFGPVGPATDVYALGGLLYFLLTGSRPFEGGSLVNSLVQVMEAPAPDPRDEDPAIPKRVAALCQAALAKAPAERPESAAAFAAALKAACEVGGATRQSAPARWLFAAVVLALGGVGLSQNLGAFQSGAHSGLSSTPTISEAPPVSQSSAAQGLPAPITVLEQDPEPVPSAGESPLVSPPPRAEASVLPANDMDLLDETTFTPDQRAEFVVQARDVVAKRPDAQSLTDLARAYLGVGDLDLARATIKRATSPGTDYPAAYRVRGMINTRSALKAPSTLGLYERAALKDFTRALELDPGDWQALRERAVLHSKLKKETEAEVDFAAWIEARPSALAYTSRAFFEERRGRRAAAKADFERALELEADDPNALQNLSGIAQSEGRLRQASDYLKLTPTSAPTLKTQINLLVKLKDHQRVIETCLLLEALEPKGTKAPLKRALAHQSLGRYEASRAPLDRLLALQPEHKEGLMRLAVALIELKEWALLVEVCDRILALQPPLDEQGLRRFKEARARAVNALERPTQGPR